MSFHFNSSSDDDGEIDLDEFDDTGLLALSSRQTAVTAAAAQNSSASSRTPPDTNSNGWKVEDDDEDLSNVDWEDAEDHDSNESSDADESLDKKLPAQNFPSHGVTVTFSSVSNTPAEERDHAENELRAYQTGEGPTKKRKRSIVRVLRDVPHHTQQLILGVRRAHLLCCAARSMKCSSLCSVGVENTKDNGNASTPSDCESRCLLMHVAHSLVPIQFHSTPSDSYKRPDANVAAPKRKYNIPSNQQLRDFSKWFFHFVNAAERRRNAIRRNIAQGASAAAASAAGSGGSPRLATSSKRRPRRTSNLNHSTTERRRNTRENEAEENYIPEVDAQAPSNIPSAQNLLTKLMYLAPCYDDDPQLFLDEGVDVIQVAESITPLEKVLLFLVIIRSLGWRARFVAAFDPLPLQLTVDHPLLEFNSSTTVNVNYTGTSCRQLFPLIQNTIRLMIEGGMFQCSNSSKVSKKSKSDTFGLVSSGDDDTKRTSSNKTKHTNTPRNRMRSTLPSERMPSEDRQTEQSLSWVEVLCEDEAKESKQRTLQTENRSIKTQPLQNVKWISILPQEQSYDNPLDVELVLAQLEEYSSENTTTPKNTKRLSKQWSVNKSAKFSKPKPVSYVLAVEHFQSSNSKSLVRFTDVTPRYASSWSQTLRLRGATGKEIAQGGGMCTDEWWKESLKSFNQHYQCKSSPSKANLQSSNVGVAASRKTKKESPIHVTKSLNSCGQEVEVLEIDSSDDEIPSRPSFDESDVDDAHHVESEELTDTIQKEPIPTSKAAFKQHPQYVIPSVLNSQDVLHPDARKHICGVFKGELIYRRKDVSKALRAKQWLYRGRKVKQSELNNPVKTVKVKKIRASAGFQALASYVSEPNEESLPTKYTDEDEGGIAMENLYGVWQTKPWSPPPVGPDDAIPVNEYKNIELALLNPGLTHMEQPRLSVVARRLGIAYAPCMTGYEGHKGNRTPSIRGIAVHNHNVELLNEAYFEYESQQIEAEVESRRRSILKKWKRLVVGILTKDRLDREYS
ncbi:hypothetical protein ACHAW6_015558 [Cyclotella cf. meneghiniana]